MVEQYLLYMTSSCKRNARHTVSEGLNISSLDCTFVPRIEVHNEQKNFK